MSTPQSVWASRCLRRNEPQSAGSRPGSYNHRWNTQLLRGLEDLAQLRRQDIPAWQLSQFGLPSDVPGDHDWQFVELLSDEIHGPTFFEQTWTQWRDAVAAP